MPKGNPNPKNKFKRGNKAARQAYAKPMGSQMNIRVLKSQRDAFYAQCRAMKVKAADVLRAFVVGYGGWKA